MVRFSQVGGGREEKHAHLGRVQRKQGGGVRDSAKAVLAIGLRNRDYLAGSLLSTTYDCDERCGSLHIHWLYFADA